MAGSIWEQSQAGLRHITFNNLNLVAQKICQPVAMPLKQRIEDGRLFQHLLEAPICWIGLLAADQQINSFYFGQIQKSIRQPYLANESGYPNQQDLLACKGTAHGKSGSLPVSVEMDDRPNLCRNLAMGRNHRSAKSFDRNIEMSRQSLRSAAAIRHIFL